MNALQRHRRRAPAAAAAFLAAVATALAGAAHGDLYVSPGGDDAHDGSIGAPLQTLEGARDAVRQLIAADEIPSGGLTVWLREGDYVRDRTFLLSAEDSGSQGRPIVWRAYQDERVRLLGGRRLAGFAPVNDAASLARLPEAARPHVVKLDLRAQGIHEFGEFASRGFSRPTTPAHSELFFGGRPMTLARWPNEGQWTHIAGYPAESERTDEHNAKVGELPGGFSYEGDQPRRWKSADGVWVHGYWSYDWANSYERVAALEPDRRLVRTAEPYGLYGFKKGQRFYFLNVLEELDQPGEWYLDRASGVLYFWPTGPIDSAEAILSVLAEPLIRIAGASHLTLQGLDLQATRASGVEISGGASNRVVGCRLQNIGNWGVTIDGGADHTVVSCDIEDTGDGGVSLSGGDRQTLAPGGHVAANCRFARQGRWSKCYVPAVLIGGVGHRAAHNLIHEHPHCAILFNGNDHLIEFNDIHHIALETGDVGAIYTGRDFTFRGNRIRHNFIHETGGVGMGSMGVYMDDCVSGTEVYGNVFYKAHWAMFIGGGRDHRIENNLFVACDPAIRADGRGLDTMPVWREMVNTVMRARLADVPADLYRQRYPALKSLDQYYGPPGGPAIAAEQFRGTPPEGNVISRNVCLGPWLELAWHVDASMLELRENLVADAASATVDEGLRQMASDEARQLGIRPIPFEEIGPQPDADRQRLERVR